MPKRNLTIIKTASNKLEPRPDKKTPGFAIINANLTLEQLASRINEDHEAVLAAYRSSIERALDAGNRLDEVKQRVGYGHYGAWVKRNCSFSIASAQLYHRIARRLAEMPDMRAKILELDLNKADELMRREREKRMNAERLDLQSLESALCEYVCGASEVVQQTKKRVGDNAWERWVGPTADFVKLLLEPPRPLSLPLELKLDEEDSTEDEDGPFEMDEE